MGADNLEVRKRLAVAFEDPVRPPVLHFCSDSVEVADCGRGEDLIDAAVLHVGRWRYARLPFEGYAGEEDTREEEDRAVIEARRSRRGRTSSDRREDSRGGRRGAA